MSYDRVPGKVVVHSERMSETKDMGGFSSSSDTMCRMADPLGLQNTMGAMSSEATFGSTQRTSGTYGYNRYNERGLMQGRAGTNYMGLTAGRSATYGPSRAYRRGGVRRPRRRRARRARGAASADNGENTSSSEDDGGYTSSDTSSDESDGERSYSMRPRRRRIGFQPRPYINYVDAMGDSDIVSGRNGMSVSECLMHKEDPLVRWPHTDLIISHLSQINLNLDFTCGASTLNELMTSGRTGLTPLKLKIDNSALQQHFEGVTSLATRQGYDIVPHEIYVVRIINKNVPMGFLAQLYTLDNSNHKVPWFTTNRLASVQSVSAHSRTQHFTGSGSVRIDPGQVTPRMRELVYVNDEEKVNQPHWCRWAGLDHDNLHDSVRANHALGHDPMMYQFHYQNDQATQADDAVSYLVLQNFHQLLERCQQTSRYNNFELKDALTVNPDSSFTITLPRMVVDEMLNISTQMVGASEHLMRLSNACLELTPHMTWGAMKNTLETMHRSMPQYLANPIITLSVTVNIIGALVPKAPAR